MRMTAHDCAVLVVCGSWLAACGDSGPARESVLAEIAADMAVEVTVLGTADEPATARRALVTLTPAMRDSSGELVCPVLDAAATINGLPLAQTERGGSIEGSSGVIGSQAGCRVIAFDRALEGEAELDEDLSTLILEDESTRLRIEARNIFAAPTAEIVPSGAALEQESTAELAIAPGPGVLPVQFRLRFIGESSEQSFTYELAGQSDAEIELTDRGIRFPVPHVAPGPGRIEIEGTGHIDAFRGHVERCDGVASCAFWRAACASSSCRAATSLPMAFDKIALDTEVVAPP